MKRCRPLLGTFVEVTCGDDAPIEAAFAALAMVHSLMSAHEPESDLGRINRIAHVRPVPLHRWTAQVLERSLFWSKASDGAFDVVRAGAAALGAGLLPRHPDQPEPDPTCDWRAVRLESGSVTLSRPACLDLGGIAKGFAVDRAIDAMVAAGAQSGLVNAGGDLRGFGSEGWPVAVLDPQTRQKRLALEVRDAAIATSAGHWEAGSLEFGHLPASNRRWTSISVRAPTACDADALTKIVHSGSAETHRCLALAEGEAIAIRRDGGVEPVEPQFAGAA